MDNLDLNLPALREFTLFAGMDDETLRAALRALRAESAAFRRGALVQDRKSVV